MKKICILGIVGSILLVIVSTAIAGPRIVAFRIEEIGAAIRYYPDTYVVVVELDDDRPVTDTTEVVVAGKTLYRESKFLWIGVGISDDTEELSIRFWHEDDWEIYPINLVRVYLFLPVVYNYYGGVVTTSTPPAVLSGTPEPFSGPK